MWTLPLTSLPIGSSVFVITRHIKPGLNTADTTRAYLSHTEMRRIERCQHIVRFDSRNIFLPESTAGTIPKAPAKSHSPVVKSPELRIQKLSCGSFLWLKGQNRDMRMAGCFKHEAVF